MLRVPDVNSAPAINNARLRENQFLAQPLPFYSKKRFASRTKRQVGIARTIIFDLVKKYESVKLSSKHDFQKKNLSSEYNYLVLFIERKTCPSRAVKKSLKAGFLVICPEGLKHLSLSQWLAGHKTRRQREF